MTPLARVEDAALLTGQGRFLDDLDPLPGTLVAAVVRSPHAHARIRSVDLERARSMPGVAAVIGPEEVLATLKRLSLDETHLLRTDGRPVWAGRSDGLRPKARCRGHRVLSGVASDRQLDSASRRGARREPGAICRR